MSRALEIAERAIAAAPPGDSLAVVTTERSLLLRFARSCPTQATSVGDLSVEISARVDGHTGSAITNRLGDEALAACGRAAREAAEAAARAGPGSYPDFPAPAPVREHDGFDEATARLDPSPGGAALETAFAAAAGHGVEAHGVWTSGSVETAVASSAGAAARDRMTDAFMKVTCIAPSGRSGYSARAAAAAGELDADALARDAAERAAGTISSRPGEEATRLEAGEYPVVLEAHAVGELAGWLGTLAFNGLAYVEERSALVGRLGTRVASPSVNLADSPHHPRTLPRAFDAEGVAKKPLPLIQDGIAHRVVHDTHSAALAGASSTGHATRPGGASDPAPANLVLAGGGARDARELCRTIERGIYVTRLWYTNAVRPKETLLTGVTRDGTFLIEDGEIAAPLADMRFTDSVLGLFARVEDLGARPVLTSEGEFYGRRNASGVVCPPLRAASMRFTD